MFIFILRFFRASTEGKNNREIPIYTAYRKMRPEKIHTIFLSFKNSPHDKNKSLLTPDSRSSPFTLDHSHSRSHPDSRNHTRCTGGSGSCQVVGSPMVN